MTGADHVSHAAGAGVVVVVPTYNERENVEPLLRAVRPALPDADVLIVDDNSPDGTADAADAVGAELGRIEVLRRAEQERVGQRLPGRVRPGAGP